MGVLTYNVVKTRPDLYDMVGFTVRVPRSLDIEANDGPQRVWVQGPKDVVVEGKPVTFPTVVLSAAELLAVYRGEGGAGEAVDDTRGADSGLGKAPSINDPSRAENLNSAFWKVASVDRKGFRKDPREGIHRAKRLR